MSIYENNYITRKVSGEVPAYRLVKSAKGVASLAGASDVPFGAVTEAAVDDESRQGIADLRPGIVRVYTAQAVVPIETEATGFNEGDKVFAAANGKVAKTGTVAVGIADKPENDKRGVKTVRVALFKNAEVKNTSE